MIIPLVAPLDGDLFGTLSKGDSPYVTSYDQIGATNISVGGERFDWVSNGTLRTRAGDGYSFYATKDRLNVRWWRYQFLYYNGKGEMYGKNKD